MLYATSPGLASRIHRILERDAGIYTTYAWSALEHAAHRASCAIVASDAPFDDAWLRRLGMLRDHGLQAPLIVATLRDADVARDLAASGVREVVWLDRLAPGLPIALARARRHQPLREIANQVQACDALPQMLRNALVCLCERTCTVRTIRELCQVTGYHRGTLWQQWERAWGRRDHPRLQDAVDRLLLYQAALVRGPRTGWSASAEALGVHPHTLGRIATRLLGCQLRTLAPARTQVIVRQRVNEMFAQLLATGAGDDARSDLGGGQNGTAVDVLRERAADDAASLTMSPHSAVAATR